MANAQKCSQCGAELDPGLPRGLCAQCLISLGLASGLHETLADTALSVPKAEPTDSSTSPTLGRFGDYELIEEIARGGMGVVYKARQLSLGRIVAVKMILAGQFVDKKVIQRFRGEVTAAALLQHPNIVSVHEVGIHAGQHFFSMEYVEGQSLAQLVGNRPLPPTKAARYLKLIADAIHYAHSQGILHRDLKPSNILIDAATDQPRVTDFGLAKRLDSESSLTVTGQVLGSPGFMPPEQASPDRGKVGRRSDVYALGAILYHLLTARAPFQAESLPAIVTQVLNTEPIPPRLLNPSIPRDLETICLKCLEKEPARRYATAKELADELGRFLQDEPILARPTGPTARLWRWCRRKPALATLGALVVVLVLVVVVGSPIAIIRIDRARVEAEGRSYAADMRLASEALRNGAIGQVQELLRTHEPGKGVEDLRGFEWRYLRHAADQTGLVTHQLQGVRGSRSLVLTGGTLYNLHQETGEILAWDMTTWAPLPLKLPAQRASERWWWYPAQQAAVAVNDKHHTMALYRLPGFEEGPVIAMPGQAIKAAVSKVLHTLAVAFQDGDIHRILVWDLAANSQRGVFGEYRGKVTYLGFSPDVSVLAAACDDGEIGLWSIADGKALPSPARDPSTTEEAWEQPPFFGPGSTRLYLNRSRERKTLEVWDWSAGKLSILYQADQGRIGAFDFSPDGAVLATAWAGVIALFDAKESRQSGAMSANGPTITCLAFSPSRSLIASGSRDRAAKLWDVKTQRELQTLGRNDDQVSAVAFTPDEKSVITLSSDGKIKVWDLRAVLRRGVLWSTTNLIADCAVSADDTTIATVDSVGAIHVWDLVSGGEIQTVQTGDTPIAISISPTDHIVAWAGFKSLGILDYGSGRTNTFPFSRAELLRPSTPIWPMERRR